MSTNTGFLIASGNLVSSGQSYMSAFVLPLFANNESVLANGTTVTYAYTITSGGAVHGPQVAVVTEADVADIVESDRAMADARRHGTKPWSRLRRELGL